MTKPVYARPTNLTRPFGDTTTAELVWTAVRWANYYKLETSRRPFDGSHVATQTITSEAPNVNAVTVTDLTPDTKHYARVAVCNWEGVRLSPWSAVKTFRTDKP